MMKGEINNSIMVWSVATILFWYSYKIGKNVPKGIRRLVALFPPIIILLLLPKRLTNVHLIYIFSFSHSWLSTFKLLLFSFAKGPLSSNPPHCLSHFLFLAALPIKFQHKIDNQIKLPSLNWFDFVVLSILAYFFLPSYENKQSFHQVTFMCLHLYFGLEIFLFLITAITRKLLQVELEKPFDKPYLSTSLQDYWGRRWNIMVTRILHTSIYEPMLKAFSHVIGRKWAPIPAVLVTFMVSGFMHELMFYYMKHDTTWKTWELCWDSICFFLIHGVCVALQIAYKKIFKPKHDILPRVVSCTLTMAFVIFTGIWLYIPALIRCGVSFTQKS
ncbi:acyl-CoA--sterol O-acyltransferase 1-like [Trifolium pratense]|nr:acyl-CoA--sterol O-acyltransferase 1-like [Trifolium pratense]